MLLTEKEKNFQLREDKKNDKDQVTYIVESGNKLQVVSAFIFDIRKLCVSGSKASDAHMCKIAFTIIAQTQVN